MTLDEATKYVEEEAIKEEKLCKLDDAASGYLRSHNESIRTSDAKRHEKHAEELRQFAEWFKGLKKLMEQTRWIPVKERLPEVTGYYLIQYSRKVCPNEKAVAFYSVEEKESDPDYDWEFKPQCGEYEEVLAWMPLPDDFEKENDEIFCGCTNEEISESFVDSVEAVKDLLPKSECGMEEMNAQQMEFPETFEEFAKDYGFKDDKEVYTNGSDLIPIFRVKQWLAHDNKLRALEADATYECGKHANKWIPVSEKLPKEFEFVNCTCHSLIDNREDWVVETVYIPQPSDSPYSDWGNIPMLNWGECEVVAWTHREIPEPYKAESEDKE